MKPSMIRALDSSSEGRVKLGMVHWRGVTPTEGQSMSKVGRQSKCSDRSELTRERTFGRGDLEVEQTEHHLEMRVHRHGRLALLRHVLNIWIYESNAVSSLDQLIPLRWDTRKTSRLTVVGKLVPRLLRRLDLLVRMRPDLIVRLVERDLLCAIGVEDDLLPSGRDIVEELDDPGDEAHLAALEQDGDGDPELLSERESLVFDLYIARHLDLKQRREMYVRIDCARRG